MKRTLRCTQCNKLNPAFRVANNGNDAQNWFFCNKKCQSAHWLTLTLQQRQQQQCTVRKGKRTHRAFIHERELYDDDNGASRVLVTMAAFIPPQTSASSSAHKTKFIDRAFDASFTFLPGSENKDEDRFSLTDKGDTDTNKKLLVAGVFDGHGGKIVAERLTNERGELARSVTEQKKRLQETETEGGSKAARDKLRDLSIVQDAFFEFENELDLTSERVRRKVRNLFVTWDKKMLREFSKDKEGKSLFVGKSKFEIEEGANAGATALMVMVRSSTVLVAWAGDSRALLLNVKRKSGDMQNGDWLSVDHTLQNEDERQHVLEIDGGARIDDDKRPEVRDDLLELLSNAFIRNAKNNLIKEAGQFVEMFDKEILEKFEQFIKQKRKLDKETKDSIIEFLNEKRDNVFIKFLDEKFSARVEDIALLEAFNHLENPHGRVLYKEKSAGEDERIILGPIPTRGFGDYDFKRLSDTDDEYAYNGWQSAEPEIDVLHLSNNNEESFLIMATDGFWDQADFEVSVDKPSMGIRSGQVAQQRIRKIIAGAAGNMNNVLASLIAMSQLTVDAVTRVFRETKKNEDKDPGSALVEARDAAKEAKEGTPLRRDLDMNRDDVTIVVYRFKKITSTQ